MCSVLPQQQPKTATKPSCILAHSGIQYSYVSSQPTGTCITGIFSITVCIWRHCFREENALLLHSLSTFTVTKEGLNWVECFAPENLAIMKHYSSGESDVYMLHESFNCTGRHTGVGGQDVTRCKWLLFLSHSSTSGSQNLISKGQNASSKSLFFQK